MLSVLMTGYLFANARGNRIKLLLHALHANEVPFINGGEPINVPQIPTLLSLAVIILTLLITMVASLLKVRADRSD